MAEQTFQVGSSVGVWATCLRSWERGMLFKLSKLAGGKKAHLASCSVTW